MAQVLNKDPITYQRERDGFLRELQHFHDTRGTPFRRVPQINGQEVDLYLLYVLVTAHGGWLKVNHRNEWEDLLEQFKLPQRCVNSGVALKQVYLRYLDRYEKVHFLGDDGGRGSDDDDDSRHKRWSARALHAVPLTYNAYQHNLTDNQRAYHGLSTDLFKPSDYDKLAMSLMSPLPNEQDFAINVVTLLSNEGRHTLKLDKCPRLVEFLLAHAAVFSNEGTKNLFQDVYGKVRRSSMTHFWADVLEDPELAHLADETQWPLKSRTSLDSRVFRTDSAYTIGKSRFSNKNTFQSDNELDEECAMDVDYPSDVVLGRRKSGESSKTDSGKKKEPRFKIEPSDLELFCLGRSMGTQDHLGQRVVQVATILRNLSFGEENQSLLATNPTFIRFILLCMSSRWDSLKQLGLDTLGNIASEIPMERLSSDPLLQLILSSITQRLYGQDRAGIIAALEVLNKLGQREDNEDAIQRSLDGKIFEQICQYLTLHDIMLLMHTLECLYSLSSLGEKACNCIVRVHGAVDTLVSLITVEAQSYGPKACILMRVVETVTTHDGSGHSNLTVLQPPASSSLHQPDHSQAGHSGLNTQAISSLQHQLAKKVYPATSVATKPISIRPSFVTSQSTSGSPVVTLHPQLALQQHNPNQPTMFPPSSHHSILPASSSVQSNATAIQPQPTPASSQMMSVIAQAPPMSAPASVIQHPPSSQSPQPSRQTATPPPSQSQTASAQLSAQDSVVKENEQFAATFLRATYENVPGSRVEQSEVYNKYLSACAKAGRKGVIAPHHFPKCVRTVFGVTSVPVVKPVMLAGDTAGLSKQHFYEGIKVRPKPIPIHLERTAPGTSGVTVDKRPTKAKKALAASAGTAPLVSSTSSDNADPGPSTSVPSSTSSFTQPSSILLSQLSAPPKPKDTPSTPDNANQVTTHPHLSQALLGSETSSTACTSVAASTSASSNNLSQPTSSGAQSSNTSLIKSLLATKVGETGLTSTQPAGMSGNLTSYNTDISNTQQVAQRQRLQQQQLQQPAQAQPQSVPAPAPLPIPALVASKPEATELTPTTPAVESTQQPQPEAQVVVQVAQQSPALVPTSSDQIPGGLLASTIINHKGKPVRVARINGARTPGILQLQPQIDAPETENHTGGSGLQGRRDPPQPPPLAPLSSGSNRVVPQEVTDSASVIKCTNNVIIADENLTKAGNQSMEGVLVNGAAHLEIKSEIKEEGTIEETKPISKGNLMLVDLLEKSVDVKEPPVLNGGLSCKDLCISERGLELVSKGPKSDLGKQIRITERGLEVVDTATGGTEKELLGMELRLTERGLELVDKQGEAPQPVVVAPPAVPQDNVLQKELLVGERLLEFLEKQDGNLEDEIMVGPEGDLASSLKRPAGDADDKSDVKRLRLEVNGNGSNSGDESSQGEEKVKASSAAANLYSALAASILDDEEETLMPPLPDTTVPDTLPVKEEAVEPQTGSVDQSVAQISVPSQPQLQLVQSGGTLRQVYVSSDPNQAAPQQVMMAGTRQIIVSQALTGQNQVLITTAGGSIALQGTAGAAGTATLKTVSGQTLPMLMTSAGGGSVIAGAVARPAQYVVSQQGQQLQLVQPGNQIQLTSTGVGGQQFLMAQPQTALIQGQPQTVLVAQTPQQQGTNAKTIIILQQQPSSGASVPVSAVGAVTATQQAVQAVHQKVLAVTPQGQQVMVTPVQRPVIQAGAVSQTPPALVATAQQPSPSPSPAPTGIPTPVLTANPSPTATPPPIPTPTITANPNAGGVAVAGASGAAGSAAGALATAVASAVASGSVVASSVASGSAVAVTGAVATAVASTSGSGSTAGVATRANVVRPSPTPSPSSTASTSAASKPNGVTACPKIATRSSVAKAATLNTVTPATPGPSSTAATSTTATATVPKVAALPSTAPRAGGMPSPAPRPPNQSMFLCEWRGCMRSFKSANEVYMHACESHCPSGSQEIQCLWERCDAMKRKRFSLMTHLFDRHCNADVLRMMAVRRRQLSQSGRSEIPPPQPPPPHPGYAPNAAFHAIKRHALEFVNPKELLDDNEGPVTKSIRLTAALILRNLVIYSNSGRRLLRSHEPHLASVALSNVESSRTVAQVLYDMNHATGNR
ncbi:AT-rich interactive domain-containing protein 2 isoform X2 [Thrips palmi]|uniref:AT-rich interactive domain-containing protein 2 isoform X2 n=1 Tax=Thrips palmi TaxID=161013 RepID=A0A6P9A0L9_THRPL|nr:AT-rich interactive domain-containing protein 2 isoform X2 [Thrips palmi]